MASESSETKPIVTVSSRIVYKNPWITVHEDKTLRNGDQEGIYGVIETNDSVIICAVNDNQELYIVYGYSYPTDTWSWQVPGGGGEKQPPLEAAERELKEETGITAEQFEQIGDTIVTCGLLTERMATVVATNLKRGERPDADDADSIGRGKFVSFDELRRMILNGAICDAQSIAAIYLAEQWLNR
jgi:8-oxo-dGTP pyrophosphatase MutT (NUDIX family)